jgi:hypothetical protein
LQARATVPLAISYQESEGLEGIDDWPKEYLYCS